MAAEEQLRFDVSFYLFNDQLFIGVYLLHNVVLVCAVEQSESVTRMPSLLGLPLTLPSHPSGSSQSPERGSLCLQQLPASCLFHTWRCVHVIAVRPLPLPPHVHMPFLSVCISVPALKIGSSVLYHFSRLHTYAVNIWYLFFSFWLCLTLYDRLYPSTYLANFKYIWSCSHDCCNLLVVVSMTIITVTTGNTIIVDHGD